MNTKYQLPVKALKIKGLPCTSKRTFLHYVKTCLFECAIKNEDAFLRQGLKNQFIHESVQQREARETRNRILKNKYNEVRLQGTEVTSPTYEQQPPLYLLSNHKEGIFTIHAYGPKGIACMDIWLQLFKSKTNVDLTKISIDAKESYSNIYPVVSKKDNETYTSNNWIPYRNCKEADGFFYDMDKSPKTLVNFTERLKKNLETFLISTCDMTSLEPESIWLAITGIKYKGEQLALNKQQKQFFEITFDCNYKLPDTFALGQNVAYGNGVFTKVTNNSLYVHRENNLKKTKRKRIRI